MSKAKKCDKCGAFYEPYRTNIIVITKDSLSSDGLDLCPDCMDTFKKWLKNDVQMVLFGSSENTSECQEENYESEAADAKKEQENSEK